MIISGFLHASWTSDHTEKITKFKQLDAWFFNESCAFYKDGMTPEHKEPPYYSPPSERNWVYPDPEAKIWWKTRGQKHYYVYVWFLSARICFCVLLVFCFFARIFCLFSLRRLSVYDVYEHDLSNGGVI